MILARIAFRNVRLNYRHSLAAILSIVASFYSLVIFEGYMKDIEFIYFDGYRNRAMYGDVIVENKESHSMAAKAEPWKFDLSEGEQKVAHSFFASRQEQINTIVRFLNIQGMATNGRTSTIFYGFGHDLQEGAKTRQQWAWNTLYGVPLYKASVENSVVLGQGMGRVLGCEPILKGKVVGQNGAYIPEDRPFECYRPEIQLSVVTGDGQLNAIDLNVVGLVDAGYQEVDGKMISTSLEQAQMLANTKAISFLTLTLKDPKLTESFIKEFNSQADINKTNLRAINWQEHPAGELFKKTLSLLSIFRNFVVIVIMSISVLSVMNTMVKIIKERTREVGTLMSLGFQKVQVARVFVYEAIFLALSGCLVGALGSLVSTLVLNKMQILYKAGMLSEPVLFKIKIVPQDYLWVAALLIGITGLTAVLSVRGTLKKKIVDCLTHS